MKDYFKKLKQLFSLKDLLFTLLLFTIIIAMAFCKGENLLDVTVGEDAVDLSMSRYSMNIPYDMIESLEVADVCKDDKIVNGVADIAIRTGQWSNADWGEYSACVDLQTSKCVVARLNDGRIFVFSYKSDAKTVELYESILAHLN